MEESGEHKPDFPALAVSEDDRGLQDAPDVMGDDSELEGEPDFLLALAPGILENAPNAQAVDGRAVVAVAAPASHANRVPPNKRTWCANKGLPVPKTPLRV